MSGLLDGRHRMLPAGTVDRHEPTQTERPAQDRQFLQLGLVQDVQARVQRPIQHRRIDVTLVVSTEHDSPVPRNVLATGHTVSDAG